VAERERPRVDVERPRCPYCHEAVDGDDEKTGCGACMAWHHRGCWMEHGTCSACGALESAGVPGAVARRPVELDAAPVDRRAALASLGVGGGVALFSAAILLSALREASPTEHMASLALAFVVLGLVQLAWGAKVLWGEWS
jgi:hypothetical protein